MKLFLLLFVIHCEPSLAQATRYKFTVRYDNFDPLKNDVILINNQLLNTDNYGNVEALIPSRDITASVSSPAIDKYRIKYPVNMQIVLPKSESLVIDIFIERPYKPSSAVKAATAEDIRKVQQTIERYQRSNDAVLTKSIQQSVSRLYDSIEALIGEKSANKEELKKGRLQFMPVISQALNHYLNEAKDLADAFNALAVSLNKPEAYDQFATAVYSYNEIFELINANKSTYEQAIEHYWESRELSLKFSNLVEYALEEVHKPYILEINTVFTGKIYEFTGETNVSKRKKIGTVLKDDMILHADALRRRLNSLGERIAALNTRLSSSE